MENLEELFVGEEGDSSKINLPGGVNAQEEIAEESDEERGDLIFLANKSSDAFKGLGVRDNYQSGTQVTFPFTEIEAKPQAPLESPPAPVVRYSLVKEKPSSKHVQILTLSQNIIKISDNSMEVSRSEDLDEYWEVRQGHMSSSVLKRPPPAPRAETDQAAHPTPFSLDWQEEPMNCKHFLSPAEAADLFITNLVSRAKAERRKLIALYGDPERWKASTPEIPCEWKTSLWPPIGHFNDKLGLICIENYILTKSRFLEDWRYTIAYQGAESDSVSDHYYYQVEFGLPNRLYPVPQVTASVHFYMEVSRVIPEECPVKVLLRPETAHYKSDPEKFSLSDFALLTTLNMKLHHFKEVRF